MKGKDWGQRERGLGDGPAGRCKHPCDPYLCHHPRQLVRPRGEVELGFPSALRPSGAAQGPPAHSRCALNAERAEA